MSRIVLIAVLTISFTCVFTGSIVTAQTPWSQSVQRQSDSRAADLVSALIDHLRLVEAKEICLFEMKSAQPHSDASAQWAIRLSQIATKQQMLGDTFDNAAIAKALQSVTSLLESYPDHPRALFLDAQKLTVEREAAWHNVVIASVHPTSKRDQDRIFTNLARVTTRLGELGMQIDAARAAFDSNAKTVVDRARSADLLRLHQETLIDAVSMALLQTELFRAGGRDYIASANKAEREAEKALLQLPSDSPARIEIERLRAQAILRSGQYDRAAAQLHQLMRLVGPPLPPSIQALRLKLDTARDRLQDASQRVIEFYGSDLSRAPKSVEMDLARLEYLLATPDPQVGDWIDQIEARNGAFARRRAEAIALASLKNSSNPQSGDASMIAAQGQDWLRRGDPKRAGEFLVAAAKAERQPDRAITRATEAAAALIAANRQADAAIILAETSLANPTGDNAALAMLQSAHLHAADKTADVSLRVEQTLRNILQNWPESEQADQARTWLIKLLTSQSKIVPAAQVATNLPTNKATSAKVRAAAELWQRAATSSNPDHVTELGRVFRTAFVPLLPAAADSYRSAAAFVLDEELLVHLDDVQPSSSDTPAEQLLAFRRDTRIKQLKAPPPELLPDTVWRLMRDGRRNSLLRKRNAAVINAWQPNDQTTIGNIERAIWLGDAGSAIEAVRSLAATSKAPGKVISDAAGLFGSSDDRNTKLEAIKLWDQFAGGITKGTPTWHNAKLESIKLLSSTGSSDQAIKRAKFILLTSPPQNEALRGQYESIANQNP